MPHRLWHLVLAIGLALAVQQGALGQDTGIVEQGTGDQQEADQAADRQSTDQPAAETPSALPPITPAETRDVIDDWERQGAEDEYPGEPRGAVERWWFLGDSPAQWLMAALGVIATMISVWAVLLLKQTLRATRDAVAEAEAATAAAERSVDVTQRIGKAQTRAYLAAHKATLHDAHNGGEYTFEICIKNFGQTPAYNVSILSGIKVLKAGLEIPSIEMKTNKTNDIYPGQEVFFAMSGDHKVWPMIRDFVNSGSYDVFVVGEVRYCDAYGDEADNEFKFWMPTHIRPGANPMSVYSGDKEIP